MRELHSLDASQHAWKRWAAAQLLSFAALLLCSHAVLVLGQANWGPAWLAAIASTLLLALATIAPLKQLLATLHRNSGLLLSALLIGGLAFLAGRYSTSSLWEPLRVSTLSVSHQLLRLFSSSVVLDAPEFVLGTDRFLCRISPECSGFEGIGLISVFLGSALWIFREHFRFPRAWMLLLIGAPLIWVANSIRIVMLILIGTWVSPRLAVEGFHSLAGISIFCILSLSMLALARRNPYISKSTANSGTNWTAVYLSPLLVAVIVAILAAPFTSGLDTLYPLRPLFVGGLLLLFRKQLPKITWRPTLPALGFGLAAFGVWMTALWVRNGAPTEIGIQSEWDSLPTVWASVWIVFRITGTAWMAPLTEELAFRGFLMRRLCHPDFSKVSENQFSVFALVVSSLLFGITHEYWIAATLCGALYGMAQIRGRSLSDAVIAHATTNGLLVTYALVTGNWSVWL